MNTIKEQALQYLGQGFSIIPVGTNKKPLIDSWKQFQERRATVEEVEQWFQKWPNANIAIVTGQVSGLVVIDFDTTEALEKGKSNGLPTTPMVKTGKGCHAYFKYQDGVRNFQKRADLPGIDLRGEGGYVVAPPSVHENGNTYSWYSGSDLPLLELPQWVLARNESEKTPLKELYNGVSKGERNNSLARLVGSWANDGLTLFECMRLALTVNQKFNPPLSGKEVRECTQSIFYKHQREKTKFDSSTPITPAVIEKKYITLDQLKKLKAVNVDWLWEGYLGKGYITLLSGLPKVGKTTLLFDLIKAIKNHKPFLDLTTNQNGNILIITEEHSQFYKVRVEKASLSGDDVLVLSGFEADCYTRERVIEQIELAIKEGVALIVIDTLGEFWGVADENSAPLVQEALKKFRTIAQKNNVAFLLIHHLRKADGDYGVAHRGSGALLGAVDIGLEFKYCNEKVRNRRTLTSKSRFQQTPSELMIEWDGVGYKSLGDPAKYKAEDVKKRFIESLSENGYEGLEEIIKRMVPPPTDTLLREIVVQCRKEGLVDVVGKGVKGDPFKYKRLV